jgi:hypothetical protein
MLYHIHIDAETLHGAFASYAVDTLGFMGFQFEPNPEGVPKFAPLHPFTLKLRDAETFHKTFDLLEQYHATERHMRGYIEGEQVTYFKLDKLSARKSFDPALPIPFKVTWRRLGPNVFRESELHLTIVQSEMHPGVREKLLEMGFFLAVCKEAKRAACDIYTLQGSQQQIDTLRPMVIAFLEQLGGIANVVIKEERVARWWKSEPDFPLPPVIDAIQTFKT